MCDIHFLADALVMDEDGTNETTDSVHGLSRTCPETWEFNRSVPERYERPRCRALSQLLIIGADRDTKHMLSPQKSF